MIKRLLPDPGRVDLDDLIAGISSKPTVAPFDDELLEFTTALSRRLAKAGRGMPETEALAFWMRRSEVKRLQESFDALGGESMMLVPRGTVFHVPPANVDTLFVYSWLLATLVGNRNVVRLSERATEQANLIIGEIAALMPDYPRIASTSAMLTYGHELEITARLSAACDVRIIWGGDGTVSAVRQAPLPPHAIELTFPDRFSMSAIKVDAYQALPNDERDNLANQFYNDSYWFDQLGCSSPRLVVWVGHSDRAGAAATDFFDRLRAVIDRKSYRVDTATAVSKLLSSYGAMIDRDIHGYTTRGNELTVLDADQFPAVRGEFSGGGLFYSVFVDELEKIVEHVERRDQTLSQFGFTQPQLRSLAAALNGRGIDRMVPIGSALAFNRYWDGYDLLQEFVRRVAIDATPPRL